MYPLNNNTVLLFFKDFERDSYFQNDRYIKRLVRPLYNVFSKKQKVSGFYIWYQLLVKSLQQIGCEVHVNNYSLAKKNPEFPVGLIGYPHLLDDWNLPNPAILGPSLFDHPLNAPNLMTDPRYKLYIVTCQWMKDIFEPVYGSKCVLWYAGMDVDQWPDTSKLHKDIDVLIYDKIRWNRDVYESALTDKIIMYLRSKNIRYDIIRYKQYDHATYKNLLSRSKSMIFLCEHETQGLAYQEALASNVPVLAWNNGYWLDPRWEKFSSKPIVASSVPYFSPQCGETFSDLHNFKVVFDTFFDYIGKYQPRNYIYRNLSMQGSAKLYLKYYRSLY